MARREQEPSEGAPLHFGLTETLLLESFFINFTVDLQCFLRILGTMDLFPNNLTSSQYSDLQLDNSHDLPPTSENNVLHLIPLGLTFVMYYVLRRLYMKCIAALHTLRTKAHQPALSISVSTSVIYRCAVAHF